MTPFDRARHFLLIAGAPPENSLIDLLTEKFQEAIAEEREACAKAAEGLYGAHFMKQAGNGIAAAIRARKEGK